MEIVKRGRSKCSISGKRSPDTHKRYHFLWVFISSNHFYCIGLEPVKTRKALWFTEQNSIYWESILISDLPRGLAKGGPVAVISRTWYQGDSHGSIWNQEDLAQPMQEFSSWNSHPLSSLFWDILQSPSMPSKVPATVEHFGACCWAYNFPSLVTLLPHTWPPPGQKHPLIICSLCSHLLLVFQCWSPRAVLRGGRNISTRGFWASAQISKGLWRLPAEVFPVVLITLEWTGGEGLSRDSRYCRKSLDINDRRTTCESWDPGQRHRDSADMLAGFP